MAQETEDPQDYYEPIEQDVDMAQCLKEGLILIPPTPRFPPRISFFAPSFKLWNAFFEFFLP
jgi:hypothetical protein